LNNFLVKKGFIRIGKIVGVHGVKGNFKIRSYAESLTVFQPGNEILVTAASGRENVYEINWAQPHSKVDLLSLKGVTARDQAEALVGSDVFIEKAQLPELDDGSYYWFDLIGLEVFASDDTHLGRLDSIIQTGSNDVYVVIKGGKEILIPALESVVRCIDLKNKRMQVDLPEGLDE
jgi:16S rRNA processing protein RimM